MVLYASYKELFVQQSKNVNPKAKILENMQLEFLIWKVLKEETKNKIRPRKILKMCQLKQRRGEELTQRASWSLQGAKIQRCKNNFQIETSSVFHIQIQVAAKTALTSIFALIISNSVC